MAGVRVSSQKRKYELKTRAEHQDETRQRIIAATSELHAEVGPAKTTVAEIARRAGVQRLTVYNIQRDRHLLPELDALLRDTTDAQMGELAGALAAGFGAKEHRAPATRAAVRLALDFWTWRRLAEERLDDVAAAGLMVDSVNGVARGPAG